MPRSGTSRIQLSLAGAVTAMRERRRAPASRFMTVPSLSPNSAGARKASVRLEPAEKRLPDKLLRVGGEEEIGVAEVEDALRRGHLVHDVRRHVRAAEERGRVDAGLAEAAAGADVVDRHGDLAEVVVPQDVRGLARGGVGVGQLAVRLQRRGTLLECEEVGLARVEEAGRLAVRAEDAAGEVIERRRLGAALGGG